MKDGFVKTADGRIHYLEAGQGDPLILLHTNGNSAYEYEDVMRLLAPRYRVIAWDQPGHGDSDPASHFYTVEDFGDAVIRFMDALGLEKASVLGASIGGAVATDLGARHGGRIDRLFIVEAPVRSTEQWAKAWLDTELNYCHPTQTAEQLAPRLRNVTPALLTRWNIDRNKAGAKAMINVMWALREYDVLAAMPLVTPPTLLIFGRSSRVAAAAPLFEQKVPGATLAMMDDCGHFPMLDDPAALAGLVDGFLGSDAPQQKQLATAAGE